MSKTIPDAALDDRLAFVGTSGSGKPHELDGRFEREAKTVTTCISDAALTSIAVSLKRIADAMDGGDASQGIQNSLFFLEQKMHGQ